jgi:hypothetical protein
VHVYNAREGTKDVVSCHSIPRFTGTIAPSDRLSSLQGSDCRAMVRQSNES